MVAALEDAGLEVPRQGKNYVTVRNPDDDKRWGLNGGLYEHDFKPEQRAGGDRGDGRRAS